MTFTTPGWAFVARTVLAAGAVVAVAA